ncbi:homoserine dehydrogenase [Synergistales bacterium]|nr:homoserine dehydrogenase [Synergistales bacterium]GHV50108.1 homoserine dehydrogenase [Synergistales bacterium]
MSAVKKIGLFGCGTVGRGLVELLRDKRDWLEDKYGFLFELCLISDYLKGTVKSPHGLNPDEVLKNLAEKGDLFSMGSASSKRFTPDELIGSLQLDIVCDATPTNYETGQPSLGILRAALSSGACAVTSSKGGVGFDLAGLEKLAQGNGVKLRYESSVLSGTPLLNLTRDALAGCEISRAEGIVNGTTNYILTMMESGASYASALTEAQRLGYAEANPAGDVEGFDAAVKVCIMAQAFFGVKISVGEVKRVGITGVTPEDIKKAASEGRRVKLIAGVKREEGGITGYVGPQAIDITHPLAGVMGAANAVCLTTDNLGDVTIVGPGAGARETAQGMLADMLEIARG